MYQCIIDISENVWELCLVSKFRIRMWIFLSSSYGVAVSQMWEIFGTDTSGKINKN